MQNLKSLSNYLSIYSKNIPIELLIVIIPFLA